MLGVPEAASHFGGGLRGYVGALLRIQEDVLAVAVSDPWARVRERDPFPDPLSIRSVRPLEDDALAEYVRQNLLPPEGAAKHTWSRFWAILSLDERLSERVERILVTYRDEARRALDQGFDEVAETKRAEKFAARCDDALARMVKVRNEPLEWAGPAASGFNPQARKVIAALVDAIAEHREAIDDDAGEADQDLWQVLADVDLDPRGVRRRRK